MVNLLHRFELIYQENSNVIVQFNRSFTAVLRLEKGRKIYSKFCKKPVQFIMLSTERH
jgi:hypothetical protein